MKVILKTITLNKIKLVEIVLYLRLNEVKLVDFFYYI